jgi:G3E family GTPase
MAVATFDTLKFANTLKSAGVPDKQAEAQAVAFAEIIQVNMKDLATKDDLQIVSAEIKKDLNGKFDTIYEKLHGEQVLIRWMVGVGHLGTLGVLVRLLFFRGAP